MVNDTYRSYRPKIPNQNFRNFFINGKQPWYHVETCFVKCDCSIYKAIQRCRPDWFLLWQNAAENASKTKYCTQKWNIHLYSCTYLYAFRHCFVIRLLPRPQCSRSPGEIWANYQLLQERMIILSWLLLSAYNKLSKKMDLRINKKKTETMSVGPARAPRSLPSSVSRASRLSRVFASSPIPT